MRRRLLAEARWRGEALMIGMMNSGNKAPCTAFQRFKSKCPASSSSGCAEDKAQCCEGKMGSLRAKVRVLQMGVVTLQSNTTACWSHVNEHLLDSKKHMASLQEEMSGTLRDTASLLADLNSRIAAVEVLFSNLHADMRKGHIEQLMQFVSQREQASQDMKMLQDWMETHLADVKNGMKIHVESHITAPTSFLHEIFAKLHNVLALGRSLDIQLMRKIEEYRADVAGVRANEDAEVAVMSGDEDADVAKPYSHTKFAAASSLLGPIFNDQLTSLNDYMSKFDSSMDMLKEEIAERRADMTKLISKVAVPPAISQEPLPSHLGTVRGTSVALEIKFLLSQIDENLKGLQEDFHRHAIVEMPTTNENISMKLASIETMNKMQSTLLHEMHAKMEQLSEVVETMNTSVNGVWSNVIAQEKRNLETQEMMQKLLSFVESGATNKEHASVVLVKIVSAFLVCTIALHAWTVWSFNFCYPL